MIKQAAEHFVAILRDGSSSEDDLQPAGGEVLKAVRSASKQDAEAALAMLADCLDIEDLPRAAFLSLVCGAMVENGCSPDVLIRPLAYRVKQLIVSSARLYQACVASMPEPEGDDYDPGEAFESTRQIVSAEMPEENEAWEALNTFWRPAIAVCSVSSAARAHFRGQREVAAEIAEFHEGGHWLQLMCSVLDDEPLLVIEPQTRLGLLARISGVVDNFQLQVLLMDQFPRSGFLEKRRVSLRAAEVARGNGPQESDDEVAGAWNLYTWDVVRSDIGMPDPNDHEHWVWGEGVPDDIPVFQGRRVVLLGPPSYHRGWRSQRMFDKLPASLTVERQLSKEEVADWLRRMVEAKAAS